MDERRTLWLLILLLLAQLILLAGQAPDAESGGSRLESGLLWAVAPFARLVSGSLSLAQGVGEDFTLLGTLKQQNAELRLRVEGLERRLIELRDIEGEATRLRQAVDFAGSAPAPLIAADILYIDHVSWLQTLILYIGDADVEVNQAVADADGLVGRIVVAAGPYAKVQLLTDRAATIGAMIERTRRQGLIRGQGAGRLEMEFVPLQEDVRVGDRVISASIDGIYPRGIPIGTVIDVDSRGELFHRIQVAPAVDLGRLEKVYVLARSPVPEALKEATIDADS